MDDTQAVTQTADTPPLTFEQAYAADASPAPEPTTTTPAAAGQPATPTQPQQTEDRSAYIPRARFDEVNTKYKAAEEWKQKYAYAETLPPQEKIQEMSHWYDRWQADPMTALQEIINEMHAHPDYGPQLKSIAARALGHRQPQAPAAQADALPVIQLEDGRTVDLNALKAQWTEQMRAEYAPAVQTAQELQQERQRQAAEVSADKFATGLMTKTQALPGFKEHKEAIGKRVLEIIAQYPKTDPQTNDPRFLENALLWAYNEVALPHLGKTAQSQMLDSMQRTAAASTGVNPGSAAPTTPRRPKGFDDPSLKW